MAFNSGYTNLKFSKKRNQWENSSQSCRVIVNENENDFVKAYSYGETIFCYEDSLKSWIFNWCKFSVTTTTHQNALWNSLKKVAHDNIIGGYFTTLNNGFNFERLEISTNNLDLVERYFPNKLADFKKSIEDKKQTEKKGNSKKLALKNLENLKYKTKKAALKAFQKLFDYNARPYTINTDLYRAVLKYELTHDEIKKYFRPSDMSTILAYRIFKNGHLKLLCSEISNRYLSNRDIEENKIECDVFKMLKEFYTADEFREFLEYNDITAENPSNILDNLYIQYLALENMKDICEVENV